MEDSGMFIGHCVTDECDGLAGQEEVVLKALKNGQTLKLVAFQVENLGGLTDVCVCFGSPGTTHRDILDGAIAAGINGFEHNGQKHHFIGACGAASVAIMKKKKKVDIKIGSSENDPGFGQFHPMNSNMIRGFLETSLFDNKPKTMAVSNIWEEQLTKIKKWAAIHKKWKYARGKKGEFPAIPDDILENIPTLPMGENPILEIGFYLSTPQEHLDFILDVLYRKELGRSPALWGWYTRDKSKVCLFGKAVWEPGIRFVAFDLFAYKDQVTRGRDVRQIEVDPVHAEVLNHIIMSGKNDLKLAMPGFQFNDPEDMDGGYYQMLETVTGSDIDSGFAMEGVGDIAGCYIPKRLQLQF